MDNYNVVIGSTENYSVLISDNNSIVQINELTAAPVTSERFGITYEAQYGDSTPALIYSMPVSQTLEGISVVFIEAFNGTGASVSVGTLADPDLFFTPEESIANTTAIFEKHFCEVGPINIYLTIVPGTGASAGNVSIQVSTIPS